MVGLSQGFGGRGKAMSKTARGCRAPRRRGARQHPAILPWPSISLCLPGLARLLVAAALLPDFLAEAFAIRRERARFPARNFFNDGCRAARSASCIGSRRCAADNRAAGGAATRA